MSLLTPLFGQVWVATDGQIIISKERTSVGFEPSGFLSLAVAQLVSGSNEVTA